MKDYLRDLDGLLAPHLAGSTPCYIAIDAAFPTSHDLLHHYDLENYLTPLAHHLREHPIVLASATKREGAASRISVGKAEPIELAADDWLQFSSRFVASPFKSALRNQLIANKVRIADPGPMTMHVAWRCNSRARNWVNLWKPTGDALGPVLGEPRATQPFNPADDRIVELDLHLDQDTTMGYEFNVDLYWRNQREISR